MTIVTCVKVRDGLVLGTDSMAHIEQGGQFVRSFEHATKLFQVQDLPMGVMSYGLGNVGQRSIESLMREFSETTVVDLEDHSVGAVGKALFNFMKAQYYGHREQLPEDEEVPALGFALAGYSDGEVFPEQVQFEFPADDAPIETLPKEEFGAAWWGVAGPFLRLSKGYGPLVRFRLEEAGLAQEAIGALLDDLQIDVIFDAMPVQDAVDYAIFILNTTIDYATFSMTLSPCGGPLQVATILPDRSFNWLAKPEVSMKGARSARQS
jgi:hypothetical protein